LLLKMFKKLFFFFCFFSFKYIILWHICVVYVLFKPHFCVYVIFFSLCYSHKVKTIQNLCYFYLTEGEHLLYNSMLFMLWWDIYPPILIKPLYIVSSIYMKTNAQNMDQNFIHFFFFLFRWILFFFSSSLSYFRIELLCLIFTIRDFDT
jgi:hypothetical protein